MNRNFFLMMTLLTTFSHAVVYGTQEISAEVQSSQLQALSQEYIHNYFTANQPEQTIKQLLTANITPLQREYILHQLLTEVSQQPPQDFHQPFVDLMKNYPTQATQAADEGPYPVAIFNLNSKAYGIENIWLAYRTEQIINQLFNKDLPQAVKVIGEIIAEPNNSRRPQWLGAKNSIANLSQNQTAELSEYLKTQIRTNAGYDQLISHMALRTADVALVEKALASEQQSVREFTLRNLSQHLNPESAKSILLTSATQSKDSKFSTALLSQFSNDKNVQTFLLDQLSNKTTAGTAAYALSRSSDSVLIEQLKQQYFKTERNTEKNHALLALKLNQSTAAQLALDDIKQQVEPGSPAEKWLNSFKGEQP